MRTFSIAYARHGARALQDVAINSDGVHPWSFAAIL